MDGQTDNQVMEGDGRMDMLIDGHSDGGQTASLVMDGGGAAAEIAVGATRREGQASGSW